MDQEKYKNHGKLLSGIIYPEFFSINSDEDVLNVGCGGGIQAVVYQSQYKYMLGVDINPERLAAAQELTKIFKITNFETILSDVEKIPLDRQFDKAIAIDIIEHVINPDKVISEIHRLLKTNGKLLITFPALHDKWEHFFQFVGRKILRRKPKTIIKPGWDPDQHQYDYSVKKWQELTEQGGFKLVSSRASTLFPPLHYLGIPKFWYSNKVIHALDKFFCELPILKNYGQASVCCFVKK